MLPLEPIRHASNHVARISVIARVESRAGRDVSPVSKVCSVDAEEGMAIAEADTTIEESVVMNEK